MKIKLLFLSFLLMACGATAALAQSSVVVKPKKVVYTRKGKDIPQEKRTFVVTYPTISGAMTAAAKKKLENTISYWRVFETTLAENLGDNAWLSEMSYKVNYNGGGILDIALTQEGSGAYPDGQTVDLAVDLKTGAQIKYADVFQTAQSAKLAALADKKLAAEKAEIIKEINKGTFSETDEEKQSSREQVENLKFSAEDLEKFSVGEKGVTFIYDAGFPHVIQALAPEGRYFFTWAQLKPFVRRDGLLAQFVR
jgi:hypothetical protein